MRPGGNSADASPDRRSMLLMGTMMAGACSVDAITNNLLPITARHFTDNLTLIAVMVALNRISGFLVQPYAGWTSDRHVSRAGRRRPVLLLAWPATLVCVALLGALPFIMPAEYHRTVAVVAVLFAVNLVMQVTLDLCYGNATPMYGDLFPAGTLARANAVRTLMANGVMIVMMSLAVPLADRHGFLPYLVAMLFVSVSWAVARFGLREPVLLGPPAPARRYHPLLPLAELRDRRTRTAAAMASAVLVSFALTEMFHALFVTETLGLSMTALGWSTALGIAVSLLCPYPVGQIADRFGLRTVLVAGFALMVMVQAAFAFWVKDVFSLCATVVVFKIARVLVQVPIEPLMFQDTPAERRGSIFAGVQMTRAGLASVAVIAAGYLADVAGSYRWCYVLAGVVCAAGLIGALRLVPAGAAARTLPITS